ncbi:hypothetical protein ATN01_00255 [Buchnera aphidicola (Diuraphis noxia)]|uniref:Rhodanese domain-containing protein n=1 Tax=Buchnera aphidicola subsp. Diuraphis noxia TaxID=118101 RepID=A0A1B2H7U9_BUCDN|nr:rhodanese-like domain-containing protein [Buchnera aphidicola]ANZ22301.1 hypothetical protein ATN01_00255 [Buchnera aphidicola (Diuraphis noxia)]
MKEVIFFCNQHFILISLWFFFLILSLLLIIKINSFKDKIINNIQAIKLINKNNGIVVDTRSIEVFKKGHIVNSINIPLNQILSGNLKKIEDYKSFPVILILSEMNECKNCMAEFLKNGFNRIYVLKNGIYYWSLDHLPLVIEDK